VGILRATKGCTEYWSVRFKQSAVTEFLAFEGVKADEMWVDFYEPETKASVRQIPRQVTLLRKKVKTEAWAVRVMATAFLGCIWCNFSFLPSVIRLILRDMLSLIRVKLYDR
jgi:hypothetical protein